MTVSPTARHELEHVRQFDQRLYGFAQQEFLAYGWMLLHDEGAPRATHRAHSPVLAPAARFDRGDVDRARCAARRRLRRLAPGRPQWWRCAGRSPSGLNSHWRDCHFSNTTSAFSRCFNRHGEGVSAI